VADDRELLLKLADPAPGRPELSRFLGAAPGPAALIDVVLAQPGMERDRVDTKISRGLLDLAALTHESDRSCTELRRVGAGHSGEPSMKAFD